MNVISLQRDFKSFILNGRMQAVPGQNIFTATYMQSLSKNIQFGVQASKVVSLLLSPITLLLIF